MSTQQQKQFKILLVGDNCVDVYQYGTVDRISPEAPVPVFTPTSIVELPGMAGNVKRNLWQLGCEVIFLTHEPSRKTRLIDIKSKQHIVRIDEDVRSESLAYLPIAHGHYDAIVISDYDKGNISYDVVKQLRREFKGPIFVDTKKRELHHFEGCFVKINAEEYDRLQTHCSDIIVTMGERGVSYKTDFWPSHQVDVTDVTGAGDTFLASLAFEYLRTGSFDEAIPFAIKASTVTIQHVGVYAPTLEEINAT